MAFTGFVKVKTTDGFSLIEMLITLAVFSIITAGIFSAFNAQVRHTTREATVGHSEIEFGVAKKLIEKDLEMAGYGIADSYGTLSASFDPKAYQGTEGASAPDKLRLMGTALGFQSRQSQGWTYSVNPATPTYQQWSDAREDLQAGDRVLVMDPNSKTLITQVHDTVNYWLFIYNGPAAQMTTAHSSSSSTPLASTSRHLVYGLYGSGNSADDDTVNPYYAVQYSLGGENPAVCDSGTKSLLRAESRTNDDPGSGDPLLSCVLDFQVAFGLDRDEDGTIETWDNGGATYVNGYTRQNQRNRLKQVRVYLLVQSGGRDPAYMYPHDSIRVGETLLIDGVAQDTGREVELTQAQRHYRWKLVALNITPRNLR